MYNPALKSGAKYAISKISKMFEKNTYFAKTHISENSHDHFVWSAFVGSLEKLMMQNGIFWHKKCVDKVSSQSRDTKLKMLKNIAKL